MMGDRRVNPDNPPMPQLHKLSARFVATAPPGKHEDGWGLRLVVSVGGHSRRWVIRHTWQGKRREMGLGSWPTVSLAEARELAAQVRKQVHAGIDPLAARTATQARTFTQVAAAYIRAHRRGWGSLKHARQWVATLKTYARPLLGDKPIDQITTEDVLSVLTPIWNARTVTANRVQGRLENILAFATAQKWRTGENPAQWRGHLALILPRPSNLTRPKHHAAMPYAEVPRFMRELEGVEGYSALALRFLILTATRTGEVLGATWPEIDLEAGTWTIPAERMKAKREHRVPLAPEALRVLDALPRMVDESGYVFPGARYGRPLSTMALLGAMRALGYGVGGNRGPYVVHGFRSSFRDWAGEVSSFPSEVCEIALAHTIANRSEAAYRRGDLFEKRRLLMDAWASWCTGGGADVVSIERGRHQRTLQDSTA